MVVWWPEAAPKGSCLAKKAVAIGLLAEFCSRIPSNLAVSCGREWSECLIQDVGRRTGFELLLEAGGWWARNLLKTIPWWSIASVLLQWTVLVQILSIIWAGGDRTPVGWVAGDARRRSDVTAWLEVALAGRRKTWNPVACARLLRVQITVTFCSRQRRHSA